MREAYTVDEPLCRTIHPDRRKAAESVATGPYSFAGHFLDTSNELIHLPFALSDQFQLSLRVTNVESMSTSIL